MPNIAALLKAEIARVARKELRETTNALKRAATEARTEIAALKRRVADLERQLRQRQPSASIARKGKASGPADATEVAGPENFRFSAKYLASQRRRLGLSAVDAGRLLNASNQSIALWEKGESHPRKKYLPALAALRTLGKKQARALLAELKTSASS